MAATDKPRSPGKSIRAYCIDCCYGSYTEVKLCPAEHCALWPWRFGQRPETRGYERREGEFTATQAIHSRCRDCHETRRDCGQTDCPLYHIRDKPRISRKKYAARRSGDATPAPRVKVARRGSETRNTPVQRQSRRGRRP